MVFSEGLEAENEGAAQLWQGRERSCREDPLGSSWHIQEQRFQCSYFGLTHAAELQMVISLVV